MASDKSVVPATQHNHQNPNDCGYGCPMYPTATWPKLKSEDSAALPSPQLGKHTHGPWRRSSLQPGYIISGDDPDPICALAEFTDEGQLDFVFKSHEAYANSCLIAAAPDLLEALEHMVAVSNWATTIQSEEQYDAMIANSEAAIRKAKGETL